MLKKVIKYTNFNGEEREKTAYFNLTESEVFMLNIKTGGMLQEIINGMVERNDAMGVVNFFNTLIINSYGEKSDDGEDFIKGENYAKGKAFAQTAAYDKMFMDLLTDASGESQKAFILGIIPAKMAEEAKAGTTPKFGMIGEDNK